MTMSAPEVAYVFILAYSYTPFINNSADCVFWN